MLARLTLVFTMAVALLLPLGCQTADNRGAANESMLREHLATWSTHDLDKLMSYFADDCVYEDLPEHQTFRGKDSVRAYVKSSFDAFPDLKLEITSLITSGDGAACEWVYKGTQTGPIPNLPITGKPVSLRGSTFYQIKNGKIVREVDYWDMMTFMNQLGVKPS